MKRDGEAIHLRLIGGFSVEADGEPIVLPASCQRVAAFVALATVPTRRAHVAGSLWLDADERHASANLRSSLWRLRKMGLDLVEPVGDRVSLTCNVSVDFWRQLAWAGRVLDGLALDDDLEVDLKEVALELLPDWYDDWVALQRERLRQRMLHGLEALVRVLVERGRLARAIDVGLTAIALDPLRESAHRCVIEAHTAEGNASEARRQYGEYSKLLERELGLQPSLALARLVNWPARR
jgi:DNA-binding SARP family transcriptional activator